MLQYISQAADRSRHRFHARRLGAQYANQTAQDGAHYARALRSENIGPYSYAALKKILQLCPAIRSVQMRTNEESGIPSDFQRPLLPGLRFQGDYEMPAAQCISTCAHGPSRRNDRHAAEQVGIPVRAVHQILGRGSRPSLSAGRNVSRLQLSNFLEKPHAYQFYWELWGLGSIGCCCGEIRITCAAPLRRSTWGMRLALRSIRRWLRKALATGPASGMCSRRAEGSNFLEVGVRALLDVLPALGTADL